MNYFFRFSQFFISPLFDADFVGRELNAVQSQYENNVKLDAWRWLQIDKVRSDPSHDYHKFDTGKYYRELNLYLNLYKLKKLLLLFKIFSMSNFV